MKDLEERLLILDDQFAYVQKQHNLKRSKICYLNNMEQQTGAYD